MSKLNLHEIDEILEMYQQEEAMEDEAEKMALFDPNIEKTVDSRVYSLKNYKKQAKDPKVVE